ncbi:Enolase [Olea europaea subsp. europaea]|uniref:phosphopyruvate hydratase n=1 Tax=Olea europaea subsp. europaea TaxID=158383 RepID=A0A8S0Q8K1_OLEEU|nr:Enolase [Olea europaea subsp. europaea]
MLSRGVERERLRDGTLALQMERAHWLRGEAFSLPIGFGGKWISIWALGEIGWGAVIQKKHGQDATNVGDEGGFAPNIQEKEGLELCKTAIDKIGYTGKVTIEMNVSVSEFYGSDKTYDLNFKEERVEKAIKEKTCNALLLKLNQIGSVTEGIEAIKMPKRAGCGEIEDTFIADLSVGLATLLRIEEELGFEAIYAGAKFCVPVEPY